MLKRRLPSETWTGDVMGNISHLHKEGVSLMVKHEEQGLTWWNSRLIKPLLGEEEWFSEGPSKLGKQSHGDRLWCRWKGSGPQLCSKQIPAIACCPSCHSFIHMFPECCHHGRAWACGGVQGTHRTVFVPSEANGAEKARELQDSLTKWRGLWRQDRGWLGGTVRAFGGKDVKQ